MFPFLIVAALLVSDQPVAPVTPGPAGVEIFGRAVAASPTQMLVAYGRNSVIELNLLSRDGVVRRSSFPGYSFEIQPVDDGFLIFYYHPADQAHHVVKLREDGTFSTPRRFEPVRALASTGERVLLLADFPQELILVDRDGNVVSRGQRFTSLDFFSGEISAVAGGDTFLISWLENQTVHARLLRDDASWVSDPLVIAEDVERNLRLASDGRRFLVTWLRLARIEGQRLNDFGALLGDRFRVNDGPVPGEEALAWDGSKYILVYEAGDADLHRVDISRIGIPGPSFLYASGGRAEHAPAIASSAAGAVISWVQSVVCGFGDVLYARVDERSPILVSEGPPFRSAPVAAPLGIGFVTAWVERTDATRVHARVGDKVIDLGSEHSLGGIILASSGERALISWIEYDVRQGCSGTRIRPVVIVDAQGMVVAKLILDETDTSIAAGSDGTDFVLAWTRNRLNVGGDETLELRAMRISANGEVLDAEPRLIATEALPRRSTINWYLRSIVWTGEEYLAVWQRGQNRGTADEVFVQRFSRTLDPIESSGRLATGVFPEAAAGMDSVLIVHGAYTGTPKDDIRAIVLSNGSMLAEPLIVSAADFNTQPAVAAWGRDFVVAAGAGVYRVGANGSVVQLTTLPMIAGPPPPDRAVATQGSRVHVVWELGGEMFIRTLTLTRSRAVRH